MTPPHSHDHAPASGAAVGLVQRGLLKILLAIAVAVAATVILSGDLSIPKRILIVGFSLSLISMMGMAVKIWNEPDLRRLHFSEKEGSSATTSRFLTRYRTRFGADLWSTLFLWSSAVTLLSALFLAATQK
jgi:hypothetical protein